ncbi:hypothetical protein TWF970_001596 [Orbilia oligospora]|uniref:F-box domain-containing protein n=1 Tax=Orbilia oligospora TaxID=2813651 RepID=A0A7C8VHG7_ORBOL|nr:hypothetical protein TWF970_001596 [Orbilia oligospora]
MATGFASKATQAGPNLDDNNNDNDIDNDKENNPQNPSTKKVTESAHNPDEILNPSFIDLFIEEEPPQWTLEDLQQLHVIRGQPANTVAPFQKLPVELVEHIAYNLTHFRDIRSMANSCSFFRRILFESSNHLFWYKWSKAPHSMCRWDMGYYRQNRAYQNTIVNQQNGKRRKRCEKCMARAIPGMAFKKKTCLDCWDDLGIAANELYFINNIDISAIPHEYVKGAYAYPTSAYHHVAYPRREWDLLYFYKPGKLEGQLLTTPVQIARDGRPAKLIEYAKQTIGNMSSEILQIIKGMGYRYSQYAYYKSGPSVRREKWYAGTVEFLICPAEVVHRMLETLIIQDIGEEWMERGEYKRLEEPGKLYGRASAIAEGFRKVDCELQKEPEWLEEFGEDLSNLHECDFECHRKKRATLFKKTWWPRAEKRFVETLVGGNAIQLTDEEVSKLSAANYAWQWRDKMQKIVDGMLLECKWVIPGLSGEWTAETVKEWEKVHGKDGSTSSGYY